MKVLIEAKYNGIKLPIAITKIDISLMPTINNIIQDVEDSGVKVLRSYHRGSKLTIEYNLKSYNLDQIMRNRIELNRILKENNGGKLSFSHDYYKKYYNAYLDGEQTLDIDWEHLLDNKGKIIFLIPEGCLYSEDIKRFDFYNNNGIWQANIFNDGSIETDIDYEIKLKKESGFIGLIGNNQILQYGDVDEEDGLTLSKSIILNDKYNLWDNGSTFYAQLDLEGSLREINLSQEANNFKFDIGVIFQENRYSDIGKIAIGILDANNKPICHLLLEKNSLWGSGKYKFYVNGTIVKTGYINVSYYSEFAPFKSTNNEQIEIIKENGKITIRIIGEQASAEIAALENIKATKIQVLINGTMKASVKNVKFTKLNVPYWVDAPNRYPAGSLILINGEEGKMTVNNRFADNDEVIGSEYFKAPPGQSTVQLYVSNFSEIEYAYLTIRERWIG